MKRIAVLTSGGDAPGMNAAVRGVIEQARHRGIEVYGVSHGFKGLTEGEFEQITIGSCQSRLRQGGTFLYSARFPEFADPEVRLVAIEQMKKFEIDALVVIGGDGSFTGALRLTEHGYPVIGIPGTIDNDIPGTEYTIGFDTAVNVATEAIDKIADTAASHNRTFVVEVMGRHAGDVATWVGVATGADAIVIPENELNFDEVVRAVKHGRAEGKDYSLVILAEGVMDSHTFVQKYRELNPEDDVRGVTLSHIQRGGNPTVRDRVFATMMGAKAVDLLIDGVSGVYLGVKGEQLAQFDIIETLSNEKSQVRREFCEVNDNFSK